MNSNERRAALHRQLKVSRYPISLKKLQEDLQCSRATLYRDIAFLRDVLMAPIELDPERGVRYNEKEAERFELPGLWLSSDELHALVATQQLLARTSDGVLAKALAPLKNRIDSLLAEHSQGKRWPLERIRVIGAGVRKRDDVGFRMVATAVLERRQLSFDYLARSTNQPTHRTVSPQRLTHYRDNWYLDAFDHERDGLRSFSVDRVSHAKMLEEPAKDISEQELDTHLASSYGIFSGTPKGTATIVFSAKAARWVADEHWHSKQEGRFLSDGRYELRLPYSNAKELLMDILRYGADAEITEPASLRAQIQSLLQLTMSAYESR